MGLLVFAKGCVPINNPRVTVWKHDFSLMYQATTNTPHDVIGRTTNTPSRIKIPKHRGTTSSKRSSPKEYAVPPHPCNRLLNQRLHVIEKKSGIQSAITHAISDDQRVIDVSNAKANQIKGGIQRDLQGLQGVCFQKWRKHLHNASSHAQTVRNPLHAIRHNRRRRVHRVCVH